MQYRRDIGPLANGRAPWFVLPQAELSAQLKPLGRE
jgi:hypothetical protein